MDTTAITAPISRVGHHVGDHLPSRSAIADRLPSTNAIVSTVSDAGSGLADQITDHLGDIDVAGTVRRSRRVVARVVPWMSVAPTRRFDRRWLVVAALVAAVIGVAVLTRRRGSGPTEPPARDDWTTGSANGTTPPAAGRPDRERATTHA